KIKTLTKSIDNIHASKIINANGKYVLPGVIDPHVHYGVYTPIDEAAQTESRSAAAGGVTTMIRMLRIHESYQKKIGKQLEASKHHHHIDYSFHASILTQDQIKDIPYLKKIGINSVKIYMNLGANLNRILMDLEPGYHDIREGEVNMTDELMSSIIEEASKVHSTVLVHAEDPVICADHIKRKTESESMSETMATTTSTNSSSLKTWSDCRPSTSSEAESIRKIAVIGRKYGSNLYFVHIGSTAALEAILAEKEKGSSNFYIETCPHYLTHTTEFEKLTGKVVPPIRSKSDVQSMWSALRNGIIDTIGTDHVANRLSMKMGSGDVWSALAGFPGLATMLPVLLSKGVNENRITMEQVAEITSYNTARIFGMYPNKGTIQLGSDADLTIVDLDLRQKVTPDLLQSYSDYTIYDGWTLQGWPVLTMVRGEVIMENGSVNNESLGHGKFVGRPVVRYNKLA
ncbi:MAG TPA: amidohydrolase family protein, partial [Nitrososphaeraceae archaeon]|nr:amidohydrolase family protein [Nitrososphaeraceae archaeon]